MNAPDAPSNDGRWRPLIALVVIGCAALTLARLCPEDGWNLMGTKVKLTMPHAFAPWLTPESVTPIIPRWSPDDVQALLEEYDSQLSAAEAADASGDGAEVAPFADSVNSQTAESPLSGSPLSASPQAEGPRPEGLDPLTPQGTSEPSASIGWPTSATSADSTARTPATADSGMPLEASSGDSSASASSSSPTPTPAPVPSMASDWISSALRIRIPEEAQPAFDSLFRRLDEGVPITVLHYGDSQIEGDRISGTLRHQWQERWGGFGPGIQPPIPLVQSFSLSQSHSGDWSRHTRFGRRDSTDQDENYGLLGSYATAVADSGEGPCLTIGPEKRNHKSFGRWSNLSLWHDTVHTESILSLNGTPIDTLRPGDPPGQRLVSIPAGQTRAPRSQLCFSAAPPRLFAVHPIGGGVQWHSVAMRGSSGTLFRKLHRPTFSRQLRSIDPDLIVLQFGGNTVPYCRDSVAAVRYAGWFGRQIELFQALQPRAAILVIGPSDMAEKSGLNWTPFPRLSAVRDALKEVSLEAGAAHWDLLDVMGGLGSMPAWVKATPPLAGPDHIHFTPLGAKQVGKLLDRALWAEFRAWKKGGDRTPMTSIARRPVQAVQSIQTPNDGP